MDSAESTFGFQGNPLGYREWVVSRNEYAFQASLEATGS